MYLIRNLSRSPETKRIRAQRNGRWTSFMLDTGTRIRRKGPRYTEIDEATLLANLEDIIWGIEEGYIEVFSSNEKPLSLNDLMALRAKVNKVEPPQPVTIPAPVSNDPDIKAKETPVETAPSAKPVQVFAKKKSPGA